MHVLDYPLIHEHQIDNNVAYEHVNIIIIIIIILIIILIIIILILFSPISY
jgi:hypothetical protein